MASGNVIWKRTNSFLCLYNFNKEFVFGTFSLFIRNDHKCECCLSFTTDLCHVLFWRYHPVPSRLLTISKRGLLSVEPFEHQTVQYSEFDLEDWECSRSLNFFKWFFDAYRWRIMWGSDLLQKIFFFFTCLTMYWKFVFLYMCRALCEQHNLKNIALLPSFSQSSLTCFYYYQHWLYLHASTTLFLFHSVTYNK